MFSSLNVLIGGGSGFVGRHLVQSLKNDGAKVKVISRKANPSLDRISWDTIQDKGLPEGTNAVINLAGRNIFDISPWTSSFKKEIFDSRINTNRILVKAIHEAKAKPKCLITASGVGYYEPNGKAVYTEDWLQPEQSSAKPINFIMDLARQWEKASELDEGLAPTTRRAVVRIGVVIGSDGGIIKNSKAQFKFCLGGTVGDGSQWFPWIHVEDLSNLFKFILTNEHVSGIVNGVAPEQVRNKDFVQAFGRALNRPAINRMPEFLIRLMFGSERGDLLLRGPNVKSRAELLGFRFKYSTIEEACRASV